MRDEERELDEIEDDPPRPEVIPSNRAPTPVRDGFDLAPRRTADGWQYPDQQRQNPMSQAMQGVDASESLDYIAGMFGALLARRVFGRDPIAQGIGFMAGGLIANKMTQKPKPRWYRIVEED